MEHVPALSREALDHIEPFSRELCRWCNGLPVHDYRSGKPIVLCENHLARYKSVQEWGDE